MTIIKWIERLYGLGFYLQDTDNGLFTNTLLFTSDNYPITVVYDCTTAHSSIAVHTQENVYVAYNTDELYYVVLTLIQNNLN